jgi:hypothetical protein
VAAVTRNAGSAKPRIAPTALNRRGGAPKSNTGIQLAQKIANATTRYDATACRPTNDVTRDPSCRTFRRVDPGAVSPSRGFPRKSKSNEHRDKGEEQTGECLLQRNEVHLTTPDKERSTHGVKDARHP